MCTIAHYICLSVCLFSPCFVSFLSFLPLFRIRLHASRAFSVASECATSKLQPEGRKTVESLDELKMPPWPRSTYTVPVPCVVRSHQAKIDCKKQHKSRNSHTQHTGTATAITLSPTATEQQQQQHRHHFHLVSNFNKYAHANEFSHLALGAAAHTRSFLFPYLFPRSSLSFHFPCLLLLPFFNCFALRSAFGASMVLRLLFHFYRSLDLMESRDEKRVNKNKHFSRLWIVCVCVAHEDLPRQNTCNLNAYILLSQLSSAPSLRLITKANANTNEIISVWYRRRNSRHLARTGAVCVRCVFTHNERYFPCTKPSRRGRWEKNRMKLIINK